MCVGTYLCITGTDDVPYHELLCILSTVTSVLMPLSSEASSSSAPVFLCTDLSADVTINFLLFPVLSFFPSLPS